MAGGKETPRQKMIGMMYLVLTALLALQVSSAIMMKFKFLDDSLMGVNSTTNENNKGVVSNISTQVAKNGNMAADKKVLTAAEEVRTRTRAMIDYIEGLREEMIKTTGGKDETGMYKGAKEEEQVAIYMIGGKKNGKAYELKDKLNGYSQFLRQYNEQVPEKLARDGKEDPLSMSDREQRNKDFANLNFGQTPLVAALAVLSQKEAEILKYESDALSSLAQKVGATKLSFDKIFAMASAESKTVAAGTKYTAEMFLAASSDAITPRMTAQGRPLKVEKGKGKVEFVAQAGAYDAEGNSKQKWKGAITFNNKGRDTTFQIEQEYIVAKPVIQIQSASVQALYLNCGNELNVQVPALGATYDPAFTASGAQVIKGAKKGEVVLIPNSPEVKLNVASGGNAIGSESFKVRLIPKPDVEFFVSGKPINEKQGMPAPRSINVRAIPDESFRNFLPKDARYRVASWQVTLVRNNRPVGGTMNVTGDVANTSAMAAEARPGDRILLEVKSVQRRNFRDQTEDVKVGTIIKNIPIQ